jgi:starch-binding outer membrane protein, SusD/RagB family
MKKFIVYYIVICLIVGITFSCKDSFLEIDDPNKISSLSYPNTIYELELEVGSMYGHRSGDLWSFPMVMAAFGQEHFLFETKPDGGGFPSAQTNALSYKVDEPSVWGINPYNRTYEQIKRVNSVLESIEKLRPKVSGEELQYLDVLKGEALINRAVDYYYLTSYYGEVIDDVDNKMGVILHRRVSQSRDEVIQPRASVKACYDSILSDLGLAIQLMENNPKWQKMGNEWPSNQRGRFKPVGAKALMGKVYVFLKRWDDAEKTLKAVIDAPGVNLMSQQEFRDVWVNGNNRFNSEMLLEINSPLAKYGHWIGVTANNNTPRMYNPSIWFPFEKDGVKEYGAQEITSWSMGYYPDQNIKRYGFNLPIPKEPMDPEYIEKSLEIRADLTKHDPRLFMYAYQIWVDSIKVDDKFYKVSYPREGGPNWINSSHVWNLRKYLYDTYKTSDGDNRFAGVVNWPVIRLADVYLLYAEVMKEKGNESQALEYINKVHRRAYGYNPNAPSPFDYSSLTAPTKAPANDKVCHNNPLRYERWAELQGESVWWFDLKRWRLADIEQEYYQWVTAGGGKVNLVWADYKYAWPLPANDTEVSKGVIKQNPGY